MEMLPIKINFNIISVMFFAIIKESVMSDILKYLVRKILLIKPTKVKEKFPKETHTVFPKNFFII